MLFFHGLLTVFLVGIFFYDLTRYIIPNWMSGVLLALYPVMLLSTPSLPEDFNIWLSLAVFVAVFALGVGIFVLKFMGGGDVKLLAVLALWTGVEASIEFLMYTALLGGLLALVLIIIRPIVGFYVPAEKVSRLPRVLYEKAPLPYGLAITTSFMILLWMGRIPGLPLG